VVLKQTLKWMPMQLDQNPFFRKAITSWYDSSFACWALITMMLFVFVFALAGVVVASGEPDFAEHLWFPGLLLFLSGFLVLKVFIRLRVRSKND
jgi:hypothetical protein